MSLEEGRSRSESAFEHNLGLPSCCPLAAPSRYPMHIIFAAYVKHCPLAASGYFEPDCVTFLPLCPLAALANASSPWVPLHSLPLWWLFCSLVTLGTPLLLGLLFHALPLWWLLCPSAPSSFWLPIQDIMKTRGVRPVEKLISCPNVADTEVRP